MTFATVTGLSAWIVVAAFAGLCGWAFWVAHHPHVEERVRPQPERPVDLAAERSAYLAARERREETIALKRVA